MYLKLSNGTCRTIRGTSKVEASNRVLNNLVDAPSNPDLVNSKTSHRVLECATTWTWASGCTSGRTAAYTTCP
jgi:hypothetical protein